MSARPWSPFRHQLRAVEARLHERWEQHDGAAPPGLEAYRSSWVQTFACARRPMSQAAIASTWANGQPAILSDFHALAPSARGLLSWLRMLPADRRLHLTLELMPRDQQFSCHDVHQAERTQLVDGRRLSAAHPGLSKCLAELGASLCGAWIDAPPADRDRSAAVDWSQRALQHPDRLEVMLFGDWHCARGHLPSELSQRGAQPTVLHQSPPPLWSQLNDAEPDFGFDLGEGHFAWMTTPPLAQRSAHQQREGEGRSFDHDAASELVEEIASELGALVGVPCPVETTEIVPRRHDKQGVEQAWTEFWQRLPRRLQACLSPHRPPEGCLIHPSLPLLWAPAPPSWNDLVEAAVESMIRSGEWLTHPRDLTVRVAVRRCIALAWNPFLINWSRETLRNRFAGGPEPRAGAAETRLLPWLEQTLLGCDVGQIWASDPELSARDLRTVLQNGRHAFIWQAALSTIRGTSRSAS